MNELLSCKTCYEPESTNKSIVCANKNCPNTNSYCNKCIGKYVFKINKRICPCVIIGYDPIQRPILLDLFELRPNLSSRTILQNKKKLSMSDIKSIFHGLCQCHSFETWGRSRLLENELSNYVQLIQKEWKGSNKKSAIGKAMRFKRTFKSAAKHFVYMCRECCERR